ncbi:hypothetical protein [Nocardia rhamnosiphila]|uniref:Uncharacterized protein n=1 Tax=Nocardia rhamnosiphila TaxID=426716 RepID=A0ABV2WNZ6_9NOCA|nr:hypothetical protein [Nocardia rhamnosiphila]
MLIATLLITLGALGRRWRNGRPPRASASARPAEGSRWRGVRVVVPIGLASAGGLTATVAAVCC